jgi:hypothetical protein
MEFVSSSYLYASLTLSIHTPSISRDYVTGKEFTAANDAVDAPQAMMMPAEGGRPSMPPQ